MIFKNYILYTYFKIILQFNMLLAFNKRWLSKLLLLLVPHKQCSIIEIEWLLPEPEIPCKITHWSWAASTNQRKAQLAIAYLKNKNIIIYYYCINIISKEYLKDGYRCGGRCPDLGDIYIRHNGIEIWWISLYGFTAMSIFPMYV